MKVYIIFPSSASPFQVEAERYTRDGELIHFHLGENIVRSVRAEGLLAIVEQRDDEEPENCGTLSDRLE